MSQYVIHLSNIHNSTIAFGGNVSRLVKSNSTIEMDLLLQALEINRQLVAGISTQWESEEELYSHLKNLIAQHRGIEYQVSQLLDPK